MADTITIEAWEDDPVAAPLENQPTMNKPVGHPQPNFDPPNFPVGVAGDQPPADSYHVGTEEFRYWALPTRWPGAPRTGAAGCRTGPRGSPTTARA